jgi:hypothetical protein
MKNLTFTFTIEQVNTLLQALSVQSYKEVVGLINKIETEAKEQLSEEKTKVEEVEVEEVKEKTSKK